MAEKTAVRTRRSILAQLTGASFGFYVSNAAVFSYLAVYLYSLGYSDAEVGTITAINSAISIVAGPLWGMFADRWRSTVKALLICGGVGGVLYALVPLSAELKLAGMSVIPIIIPVAMFFRNPTTALIDNVFLRESEKHGLSYSVMRAAGSLSFAIAALIFGVVVPKTGSHITFYVALVMLVPAMLLVANVSRGSVEQGSGRSMSLKEMNFGELFRNRPLVTYMFLSATMTLTLYCGGTFLPRLLEAISVDGERVGIVMGAKAFVEVPFIMLLPLLRKKLKLEWIIAVAGLLFTVQAIIFATASGFWSIFVGALIFDGIGAGLFYGSSSVYVFALSPDHLKATAQACFGAMSAISGVIGNLVGGMISNAFGVQTFYLVISMIVAVSTVLFLLTRRDPAKNK